MNTVRRSPRDRIMLAAVELAGLDGVRQVTMSALAARAEVSRPTLYSYFPDVAHVLEAWVEREVAQVQARLRDVLAADADPIEVLSAYVDLQLTYFADSPTRALITAAALGSPPRSVTRHIEGFQADVRELLLNLHRHGRLRAGADVDLLAGLVIAGITSVAPHVVSGRLTAVEARSRLLSLLLHGALADRPD
ncbi:TetR/AcrR family transcriptional regulator [Arthrobacter antioxidans]|uniref:TetR/AcrR family transcriptional regulator n=1 Tax=Arthrobacter antioxidans TaxID=2895818 RepID=UPI00200042C6|nr:TetR/AcrR family transcriptional regulator [Arthrobacter antioxidans]